MTIPLVLSAVSLGLCVSFFFFFRWYITRKTAASQLLSDYRNEVYRLIGEIDSATDRDSLLVEERVKSLRKLLDDTDRRISVYMRELQRSRSGEAMYANLGRGIRVALDSRPPSLEAPPLQEAPPPPSAAPAAETPPPAGKPVPVPPPPETAASGTAAEAPVKRVSKKRHKQNDSGENNLFEQTAAAKPRLRVQIAKMAAQGLDPSEIASGLGISLAEVDLALNLLQRSTGK